MVLGKAERFNQRFRKKHEKVRAGQERADANAVPCCRNVLGDLIKKGTCHMPVGCGKEEEGGKTEHMSGAGGKDKQQRRDAYRINAKSRHQIMARGNQGRLVPEKAEG